MPKFSRSTICTQLYIYVCTHVRMYYLWIVICTFLTSNVFTGYKMDDDDDNDGSRHKQRKAADDKTGKVLFWIYAHLYTTKLHYAFVHKQGNKFWICVYFETGTYCRV